MKFIIFILLFCPQVFANTVTSIYRNNQAVDALKEKRITEGQRELLFSLKANPNNLVARLNLGITFIQSGDFDKAIKEFVAVEAAAAGTPDVHFLARFNIGRAKQEQKKVPEALLAYQAALDIKPDSLEAKANIEMLVNQLGGQGGSGDSQNPNPNDQNQDPKDGKGDKPKDEPNQGDSDKEKKEPQELSKSDVEKILEELKSQEQKIRALEYGNKGKENENGKAW